MIPQAGAIHICAILQARANAHSHTWQQCEHGTRLLSHHTHPVATISAIKKKQMPEKKT